MPIKFPSITVSVPGTCGELIQGWLADWDEAVLVSCPIARYSQVQIELHAGPDIRTPGNRNKLTKLKQAARLCLNHIGRAELGATVYVRSQLLPGRGMASSTADIVGVMAGLALALDYPLLPADLARLACRIEPSDSIMFADLTLLAYRGSARFEPLGPCPSFPLLMLDIGLPVDTLTYNARLNLKAVRQLAPTTAEALALLKAGLQTGDAAAIAAAATLSAVSYQRVHHNPLLDTAQRWAAETGALGIVRAHSGSVVGLLYAGDTPLAEPARWLSTRFDGLLTPTYLTSGGYLLVDNQPTVSLMEVNPTV